MKERIFNKVFSLFCLLSFLTAGSAFASVAEMPCVSMHSVNTRFSVPAEPAKGAVHLPALSISRENCKTVGETVFSNESAGSGRRKVAPGGGGSGTGVVPTPVGNTPWLLMVVLALLKCSVFCHGVISDSFRRQFGLNSK